MKKVKPLPFAMTIVSLLYFIYVVSMGSSKMIGDEVGGDPGGMLLPLVLSIFMMIGFAFITITERPSASGDTDPVVRRLFTVTLVSAVLYVVLHSLLGFVITSTLLVYVLASSYMSIDDKISLKTQVLAGLGTLVYTILVYTVFRFMTRNFLRMGRKGALPKIFGNPNFTAFLSLLVITAFLLIAIFCIYKRLKFSTVRIACLSGIISFAAVLYLYVVFKQFFMVSLVPGIINW